MLPALVVFVKDLRLKPSDMSNKWVELTGDVHVEALRLIAQLRVFFDWEEMERVVFVKRRPISTFDSILSNYVNKEERN
jgi:hypothetical protein